MPKLTIVANIQTYSDTIDLVRAELERLFPITTIEVRLAT